MQKVTPLVKLEIIPLLLCCLLDPLTNKYSMKLYDKLWIDSRNYQKNPAATKGKI